MDWLISHEGEEIPEQIEGAAAATATEEKPPEQELTESTPGSYKCNE